MSLNESTSRLADRSVSLVFFAAPFLVAVALLVGLPPSPLAAQNQQQPRVELPDEPFEYVDVPLPDHFLSNDFPQSMRFANAAIDNDNTPADNPTTNEGATLGRVLFYDASLSSNRMTSCAACHLGANSFSDPTVRSIGVFGQLTRRHSMSIINARFYQPGRFFADQRAQTLETQVLMPFVDPVEMGLDLPTLVSIVDDLDYYDPLFTDAFGDDKVTTDRISKSLAQFVRSMVSFNADYDKGRVEVDSPLDPFPNFSDQQNLGKDLFFATGPEIGSCASCHVSEAFILGPQGARNNGLDEQSTVDGGTAETTGRLEDVGAFKVASLRNVELSPPYMHDGRFATLEQVVDHYSTGVQDHDALSPELRGPDGPLRRNFSPDESAALVAFLRTLTDREIGTDLRFTNPFRNPPELEPSDGGSNPNGDSVLDSHREDEPDFAQQASPEVAGGPNTKPPLWPRFLVIGLAATAVAITTVRYRQKYVTSSH